MSQLLVRSDIFTAEVAFASLHPDDQRVVLRAAMFGDEAACSTALRDLHSLESAKRQLAERIQVPAVLAGSAGAESWRMAVWAARATGRARRSFADQLPELSAMVEREAGQAATARATAGRELDATRAVLAQVERRRDLLRKEHGSTVSLRLARLRASLVYLLVIGCETLGGSVAIAGVLGIGIGIELTDIPDTTWAVFAGLAASLSAVIACVPLLRPVLAPYTASKAASRVALVVAALSLVALALILAVLRFVASIALEGITSEVVSVGGLAQAGLGLVVTPAAIAFGWIASGNREESGITLRAVHAEEATFSREVAAAQARIAELERTLQGAEMAARRPDQLRAAFEQSVIAAEHFDRELEIERSGRFSQAMAVFNHVSQLPPAAREEVIRHIYTLVERRAAARSGALPGLSTLTLCLFAVGGLTLMGGCEDRQSARSLIVGCDPSGPDPASVCTPEFVTRVALDWADRASGAHGRTLRIIPAANAYASTRVETLLTVPSRWEGDLRLAKAEWIRSAPGVVAEGLAGIVFDAPARVVRSDLLSVVALAAHEARQDGAGGVDLILASDGRFISLGMNCEERIPTPDAAIEVLRAAHVPWDLNGFSSITLCGVSNVDASASGHAELEELWRRLLAEGRGPAPVFKSSCTGVGDPVAQQRADLAARERQARAKAARAAAAAVGE